MEYRFEYLEKQRLEERLPVLFSILHTNMDRIAPTGKGYAADLKEWMFYVLPAMSKDPRQIVLMYAGEELAGFFQYYLDVERFVMEEIQLKKQYQGTGLFRRFFEWLLEQLPDGLKTVEAYSHLNNHKSQGILEYLGLEKAGKSKDDKAYFYRGSYVRLKERIAATKTIFLTEPSEKYKEDIWKLRQEIEDSKDKDSFAGCGNLEQCGSAEEWIQTVRRGSAKETCPEGKVPANVYLALRESDQRIVGVIDLRHHIDHPVLGTWGGHIGYIVRPSERRKGYATEMLRMVLAKCKQRGMGEVMVTCSKDNAVSEKVILANGGEYEKDVLVDGEIIKRYWIKLS